MASISDIGIDLGTSQILIYMKGKGIVLREPTVVAIDRDSRDILAFGEEAKRMIGRTPGNILAIRPLRDGTVSDYELVSFMLKGFVTKAIGKHMFARPRAVLAVPTSVNEMEKRSLISTMFDAGMRRTQLLNRSLAAALGAGLPMDEAYGTMIVDISAGVSDIAVLSFGKVIVSDCAKVGGDLADVLTTLKVWQKKGFQTSAQVQASLDQVEKQNSFLGALYDLWGRNVRPSAGDRALLTRWQEEWGYNEEMILFCAAYAREAEKPMPYLDKLLGAYHAQGVTTPDQVEAARAAFAEKNAAAQTTVPQGAAPRKPGKVVREQQYTQRAYEDTGELPAWMQQRIKEMKGNA